MVALDASEHDRRAVDVAVAAALGSGARLTLVLPRSGDTLRRLADFAGAESLSGPDAAVAYLDRVAADAATWGLDVDAISAPTRDDAREVAHHAARRNVDVIVVATPPRHDRDPRHRIAERLLRLAPAPVITVPPPAARAVPLDDLVA